MKNSNMFSGIIPTILMVLFFSATASYAQRIWYHEPADEWTEALPVGNGRMGAMVFGDPVNERIQLNEDSLWPGGPEWADRNKGTPDDLETIRALLREGNHVEADALLVDRFSNQSITLSHQTLGDLSIRFEDHDNYRNYKRWLSLDSALVTTTYETDKGRVRQEVFTSYPDNVMVIRLSSDASAGLTCDIELSRPYDEGHPTVEVTSIRKGLSMSGMVTQYGGMFQSEPNPVDYGVQFQGQLKVVSGDGTITSKNGVLRLENVQTATLLFVVNTSFYHDDVEKANAEQWQRLANSTFDKLFRSHLHDYKELYDRVQLTIGDPEADLLPTDERLQKVKEGASDPDLQATLFQYGRYLLIASSRPGFNPANLQGLWNKHIAAPWNADYHLNINLQMNYWPAEVTNLSECHEPLFDFIDRLVENGKTTARTQYGFGGSVAHHATDLWAPAWMRAAQAYWGSWIHGLGWLAQHLWIRYEFTGDEVFLKDRVYPVLRELALFYSDWLTEDPADGRLFSYPSTSPENSFLTPDGRSAASSMGTAMSHQIIAEVFDNLLYSADILQIQDDFLERVNDQRERLQSGLVIGPDGRILEWDQPYEEPEKGHRHMSHLYAFFPSNQITMETTPELLQAVQNSLDYRLEHGGAGTGWSRAWLINFSARLKKPQMISEHIHEFFRHSLAQNLFGLHPPFQIDANFGYTAGIAEILLQSHQGFVELLPALPPDWSEGHVRGLRARGGLELDMKWKDGKLVESKVISDIDQSATFRYIEKEITVELKEGQSQVIDF